MKKPAKKETGHINALALRLPAFSAYCPDCKWKGDIEKCEHDIEQETWEMPSYLIVRCPRCDEWNVQSVPTTP